MCVVVRLQLERRVTTGCLSSPVLFNAKSPAGPPNSQTFAKCVARSAAILHDDRRNATLA